MNNPDTMKELFIKYAPTKREAMRVYNMVKNTELDVWSLHDIFSLKGIGRKSAELIMKVACDLYGFKEDPRAPSHRKKPKQKPNEFFLNANTSMAWEPDHMSVYKLLRREQLYFNDLLKVRGYVFLSEVLNRLGLKETPASHVLGWVYTGNDNDSNSYIDFGYLEEYVSKLKNSKRKIKRYNFHLVFNCYCILNDFNEVGRRQIVGGV